MALQPSFEQAFTELLNHLRLRPEDDGATRRLVRALSKSVAQEDATIEAGMVRSDTLHEPGLRGRMLARRVETLRVTAGAPEDELLALAEALASAELTVPSTTRVAVELVVDVEPGSYDPHARTAGIEPLELVDEFTTQGDRHPRLRGGPNEELQRIQAAIRDEANRGAWTEALHAAQALTLLPQQFPEAQRRQLAIAARRALSRPVIQGFMEHGMRVTEEQDRVTQVLEWAGPDTAEIALDYVTESPGIGPKQFLLDLLGRMPDVYPMLGPLLKSEETYKARLGAHLMGRLGEPQCLPLLKAQLEHPDESVRVAVIEALGQFEEPLVIEPLRKGLVDPAPSVRVAAATALAGRGARGVVPALVQGIDGERDPDVGAAIVAAMASVDSAEASVALATIALTKRGLLRRGGFPEALRLAAVQALAGSSSRSARSALERVAQEGKGSVAQAAGEALAKSD